jgi:hypothetical protein
VRHELAEQRRDPARRGLDRRGVERRRLALTPTAVGVLRAIQRIQRAQYGAGRLVDQRDVPEVPGRVAHRDARELTVAVRDLEAVAVETDRAVRAALGAADIAAKGAPQRRRRRTGTAHGRAGEKARERGLAGLGVHGVVVLQLDPRLRRLVQEWQGQLADAFEHRQQAPFDLRPEHFLLRVLVRAVGQRGGLVHAETQQALPRFGREHRRAIVHQRGAGQAALLEGLREPVHERLREVPLRVTAQARAVVEHAEQDRRHARPVGPEHWARAMVEVEMPQAVDVLGFVAAHLPLREARLGARGPGRAARSQAPPAHQPVSVQHAAHGRVRRHRAEPRVLLDADREIIGVEPGAPARMLVVLGAKHARERVADGPRAALILADLAPQDADRIDAFALGLVEPALDRREREAGRLPRDGVLPRLIGERGERRLQRAGGGRSGQERSDDRKAQVRPAIMAPPLAMIVGHGRPPGRGNLKAAARVGDRSTWRDGAGSTRILCGPTPTLEKRAVGRGGRRRHETQKRHERRPAVAGKALQQRVRQGSRPDRRRKAPPHRLPPATLGKDLAPPVPPPRERPGIDSEDLAQVGDPSGRRPVAQRGRQDDDGSEVHFAAEEAH